MSAWKSVWHLVDGPVRVGAMDLMLVCCGVGTVPAWGSAFGFTVELIQHRARLTEATFTARILTRSINRRTVPAPFPLGCGGPWREPIFAAPGACSWEAVFVHCPVSLSAGQAPWHHPWPALQLTSSQVSVGHRPLSPEGGASPGAVEPG